VSSLFEKEKQVDTFPAAFGSPKENRGVTSSILKGGGGNDHSFTHLEFY